MADYYVDPSIGTDTGAGTVDDPWGHTGNEIQKAMDNITKGTYGDTIHVKSTGTVDFSGTDLDYTTYGATNGTTDILAISGYTSAAWDGGMATIDLNGASTFVANTVDGLLLNCLDISGGTGSYQIDADNHIHILNCKIDGGGTTGGVTFDNQTTIWGCEITNLSGIGVSGGVTIRNNIITQGSNNIAISGSGVANNLVLITHTGNATAVQNLVAGGITNGNIIYSSVASTGQGLRMGDGCIVTNNYVEGFSGTGGIGYFANSAADIVAVMQSNRWYNCSTGMSISTLFIDADNSATTASGLTDAASGDYTLTSELQEAGWPSGFLNLAGNAIRRDIGVQGMYAAGASAGTAEQLTRQFLSDSIAAGSLSLAPESSLVGLGDEIGHWCPSWEDSANDLSGNGNNGTYNGGMGTIADVSDGGTLAYDFDGVDDKVVIPDAAALKPDYPFSLSLWIKSPVTPTTGIAVFKEMSSGTIYAYGARLTSNPRIYGYIRNNDVFQVATISNDTWYHVTVIGDGVDAILYVNGTEVDRDPQTSAVAYAATDLLFGNNTSGTSPLLGRLDDIRFFDRALTTSEITHLASSRGVTGTP